MKVQNILLYTMIAALLTGCKDDVADYEKLTNTKEGVLLYIQKAIEGGEDLTVFPQNDSRLTTFSVNYGGLGLPAEDINITLTKDQVGFDSVNTIRINNGLEPYVVLPDNAYTIDKSNLTIKKGALNSDLATINYNSNILDITKKYAIAFKANENQGYNFNSKGKTVVFYAQVQESPLAKTGWSSLVSVNHIGDGAGAAALIDNNLETYWHTPWSGTLPSWPFYATLNLAKEQYITKLVLNLRHNNGSTAPKEFDLESSKNGVNYTLVQSFANNDNTNGAELIYDLNSLLTTQYIRLKFKNGFHASWMTLAEVSLIGFK